jgi:thiamine-monophosphate kinase
MRSVASLPTGHGKDAEGALIARLRARASGLPGKDLRLGIGDDCALVRLRPGEELAVTTDLSIDRRHFRLEIHPPESIGARTLVRGLSDLAAMGARPLSAFLSVGLPRELAGRWFDRFLDGFFATAEEHGTPLAGGDLAESPLAVADIVLAGAVRRGKALLRSGARPGDLLYVTGQLGGAAAGLAQLKKLAGRGINPGTQSMPPRIPPRLNGTLKRHLFPQPRLAQGLWLARHSLASAAIDLSDGLSTDLAHLCEESGTAAELDARALPIDDGRGNDEGGGGGAHAASLGQALNGGEDYELLFTAPPAARVPDSIAGVTVTRIGRMIPRRARRPLILLQTARGSKPLEQGGWQHFS